MSVQRLSQEKYTELHENNTKSLFFFCEELKLLSEGSGRGIAGSLFNEFFGLFYEFAIFLLKTLRYLMDKSWNI